MNTNAIIANLKAKLETEKDKLYFDEQKLLEMSIEHNDEEDSEGHKYAADFRIGFRYGYRRGKQAEFDSATATLMPIVEKALALAETVRKGPAIHYPKTAPQWSFECVMKAREFLAEFNQQIKKEE